MAVIGINYCDGNYYNENDELIERPVKYKSVYLHLRKEEKVFNSGNFLKDWYYAKKTFLEYADEEEFLTQSSSVDHFIMDGAPYDSAYFIVNDEHPEGILEYKYNENGWEMFVPKGTTPTWIELKEISKK